MSDTNGLSKPEKILILFCETTVFERYAIIKSE